jgi:hypothetical protein
MATILPGHPPAGERRRVPGLIAKIRTLELELVDGAEDLLYLAAGSVR